MGGVRIAHYRYRCGDHRYVDRRRRPGYANMPGNRDDELSDDDMGRDIGCARALTDFVLGLFEKKIISSDRQNNGLISVDLAGGDKYYQKKGRKMKKIVVLIAVMLLAQD